MSDLIQIIKFFDKEFKFKCPKHELEQLHHAAIKLTNKMQIIKDTNKLASIESIAITAALNIIAEHQAEADEVTSRLGSLKNKLVWIS